MQGSQFLSQFLANRAVQGQPIQGPLFETLAALAQKPQTAPQSPAAPLAPQRERDVAPVLTVARSAPNVQLQPNTGRLDIIHTLTTCLDEAEQPETAKRIYRTLYQLGLFSLMARGLPSQHVTKVCFHLPVELLAEHLGVNRTTIWRNLKPLMEAGILDARDHYGTLRGETAVTGKLWALSLQPDRVLSGKRDKVKVTHDDLTGIKWRDLDADARKGHTAYNLLKEQKEARERAEAEQEKLAAKGHFLAVQQSINSQRVGIDINTLKEWVLVPFNQYHSVTLTVASSMEAVQGGLDTIWAIPSLEGLPKAQRGAAVEELAGKLAATYQDGHNVKFWAWLLWQTLRAYDQSQPITESVCVLLARVFHDTKFEPARKPAALVVRQLQECHLYDFLKELGHTRVGARPKAA